MKKKELIKFGQRLIAKGRTPTEIRDAIAIKTSNKKVLNEVLKQIFIDEKPTVKRSLERTKVLLDANRLRLNFEYSMKGLTRLAITVFILGGITYWLSNEEVNQNEIFGWTTIIQAVMISFLFAFVKFKGLTNLLLPAVVLYFSIWIFELLVWGMPNDLLEAYNHHNINVPPSVKLKTNAGGARLIGFMFPYLYLCMKLFLGWFIFVSFRNHRKYETLPQDVKDDLKDF